LEAKEQSEVTPKPKLKPMTKNAYIDYIKRASGLDEPEASLLAESVEQARDLITQNWPTIQKNRLEDEKKTVSFGVKTTVDTSGPKGFVKAKISGSTKWEDEAEGFVEPADQGQLFDGEAHAETVLNS
jgi:hypothetical protein